MKLNKILISLTVSLLAFISSAALYFITYSYFHRYEPILYRSQTERIDEFYVDTFIQNPFRDKSKENAADSFLNSIKGKTVSESFTDRKYMLNSYQDCGNGKLVKWELWNRFDGEEETEFRYAMTRELSPGIYHLSFVILKLDKENSEWKVKAYICKGTSIEGWKSWIL